MSSKLFSLFASVLLVQSARGCPGAYLQAPGSVVEVVSSAPAYSLGGCGSNLLGSSYGLANSGLLANNAACGLAGNAYGLTNGLGLQQSLDTLSVASGSAAAPGSISFLAENLAVGGELYAQGAAPFLGTVGVSGAVPTTGQALVSYSSAPGVGLSSGGCGQGVSGLSGVSNLGLSSLTGVNSYGLNNNLGLSSLTGVNSYGLNNNLGLSSLTGVNSYGLNNNFGLLGANNNGLGLSSYGCGC